MQAVVWDLPLPWTPQTNAAKGELVLSMTRPSDIAYSGLYGRRSSPKRANWEGIEYPLFSRTGDTKDACSRFSVGAIPRTSSSLVVAKNCFCSSRDGVTNPVSTSILAWAKPVKSALNSAPSQRRWHLQDDIPWSRTFSSFSSPYFIPVPSRCASKGIFDFTVFGVSAVAGIY